MPKAAKNLGPKGRTAKRKTSAKPGKPPSGADFAALVKKVNEVAVKADVAPLNALTTGRIPAWKRWVGGEGPDYDVKGLRDIVNTNALFTDEIKKDVDLLAQGQIEIRADVQALKEAPAPRPFP